MNMQLHMYVLLVVACRLQVIRIPVPVICKYVGMYMIHPFVSRADAAALPSDIGHRECVGAFYR